VDNLLAEQVMLNIQYQNADGFYILTQAQLMAKPVIEEPAQRISQMDIPPRSSKLLFLVYFPFNIGQQNDASITFSANRWGSLTYFVKGEPETPKPFEKQIFNSAVDSTHQQIVMFTNPFRDPLPVSIHFECPDVKNAQFVQMLTGKKGKHIFQPKSTSAIQFSYTPKSMKQVEGVLVVESERDVLRWSYPLLIVPERYVSHKPLIISGKAGNLIESNVEFKVYGSKIPEEYVNDTEWILDHYLDRFTFYLKVVDEQKQVPAVDIKVVRASFDGSEAIIHFQVRKGLYF
jgi:hypothetical protein